MTRLFLKATAAVYLVLHVPDVLRLVSVLSGIAQFVRENPESAVGAAAIASIVAVLEEYERELLDA